MDGYPQLLTAAHRRHTLLMGLTGALLLLALALFIVCGIVTFRDAAPHPAGSLPMPSAASLPWMVAGFLALWLAVAVRRTPVYVLLAIAIAGLTDEPALTAAVAQASPYTLNEILNRSPTPLVLRTVAQHGTERAARLRATALIQTQADLETLAFLPRDVEVSTRAVQSLSRDRLARAADEAPVADVRLEAACMLKDPIRILRESAVISRIHLQQRAFHFLTRPEHIAQALTLAMSDDICLPLLSRCDFAALDNLGCARVATRLYRILTHNEHSDLPDHAARYIKALYAANPRARNILESYRGTQYKLRRTEISTEEDSYEGPDLSDLEYYGDTDDSSDEDRSPLYDVIHHTCVLIPDRAGEDEDI